MAITGDIGAKNSTLFPLCDFRIYYEAGHGNFEYHVPGRPDLKWYYAHWVAIFWKPFTLFDYPVAATIWRLLQIFACLYVAHKLWEVQYGWIIGLGLIKSFSWFITSGNVAPILAALLITPIGILLAGMVKPWLLGFGGVVAGRRGLEWWYNEIYSAGRYPLLDRFGLLAFTKKKEWRLILLTVVIMCAVIYNSVVSFKWVIWGIFTHG